uniref:Uncharacterized protein n=1 Tax=Tanacetum cinerariifolium TaxID=118510 RepID=A0A699K3U7_TANCI|nr:hypothetical protein [Tanacetum cinerariifolium]
MQSVGDFSVIDDHLGVKEAAPPCGFKGQRPLRGQVTEPLAGPHCSLCVDNTDAGIVGRCNSGSNKNKGKVGR